jgi:putative DNA-invertase from lambdoid prophage Rac
MSRLLLTMLAAVAEFERELIIERTRLGLDKARRAGKRLGRPQAANAPESAAVRALRAQGRSWEQIARRLGCTPSAARRALARVAENGGSVPPSAPVENPAAG